MGSTAGRLKNAHFEGREGATARGPSAAARRRAGSGVDGWGGVLPLGCDGESKRRRRNAARRRPDKEGRKRQILRTDGRGRSASRRDDALADAFNNHNRACEGATGVSTRLGRPRWPALGRRSHTGSPSRQRGSEGAGRALNAISRSDRAVGHGSRALWGHKAAYRDKRRTAYWPTGTPSLPAIDRLNS